MTDSSTPFWKKSPERAWLARVLAACLTCLLCLVGAAWVGDSHAQRAEAPAIRQMQVERTPEGLLLSAMLAFDLSAQVEDALRKGITMHFVLEAEVLRERWYWSDLGMAKTTRYLRLSYQPLTRRWRLHTSSAPFADSGLGLALSKTYDELSDAVDAMQRVARWKIAEVGEVPEDTPVTVQMRFGLDLSQLPRPLQIGTVGRSGWNLQLAQSLRLAAGGTP